MELRLKDLNNVALENPEYATIMREVVGFERGRRFLRKRRFKKAFLKAHYLILEARKIELKDCKINPDCKIKVPENIDSISFKAMMELQANLGGGTRANNVAELITEVIAIACYSQNNKGDYISSGPKWNRFKKQILESDIPSMMGLYNHICEKAEESKLKWERFFLSVQVEDKEYDQAGGQRMGQFNVLTTIKNICADFNCSYDEAWQVSYALTQTNSYAKATYNHIQDNMRQIKEIKMRQERKKKQFG